MRYDLQGTYEQMLALGRLVALLDVEAVGAVVDEFSRMHSVMPILDPTAYIKLRGTMPDHETFARALYTFRKTIEQFKLEEMTT